MFSFLMSFLKGKGFYILVICLSLCLAWFYLRNETLEVKLEKEKLAGAVWQESANAGQITIDSLLTHQKAMNENMLELEQTKSILRDKTKEDKEKLVEYAAHDEQSKEWAKNEIPKNIQNILADGD